jgi:hypothetical protein
MGWPKVVAQQQTQGVRRPAVDGVDLDIEVAAIHQCVAALDLLQPESIGRVLAYIEARFKNPYRFEDAHEVRE